MLASTVAATILDENTIRQTLEKGLADRFKKARVLVLIPDHTRTAPLPLFFRLLTQILGDCQQLDFMVALGTHPPLSEESLCKLVGITPEEHRSTYAKIGLLNHAWDDPNALTEIGTLSQDHIQHLAGVAWHPSLGGDVPIRINKAVLAYDQILILGPVFPHEVVGFSGGAKYLFPGISGAEIINVTHWLGALITILDTIGIKDTPMRAMLHAAAECVPTPILLLGFVVVGDGLAGIFIGDHLSAWHAAADLSAQRHIVWLDEPYQRVLSQAPTMYDELWTAAKAMYKLEPGIADGGEVVVYAPHLATVSHVHGAHMAKIGYHVRDYFLHQWEQFKQVPLGVLAHSTHLKGSGSFSKGVEKPRIHVRLASRLSAAECSALALGYADPSHINPADWAGEGALYVPKAGEMLYRVKPA